jgi:hypothetical protein
MAKVVLSGLITSLSGKLAGSVFQKTVGGLQVRTKVSPRNPRTARQQMRRSEWSFAALSWLTFNAAEIASWNDNAPPLSSGVAFFLETNAKIQTAGQPLLRTYTPGTVTATAAANFNTLTAGSIILNDLSLLQKIQDNEFLNIFMTRNLPGSTTFLSPSDYVLIETLPPFTSTDAPVDVTVAYSLRFPSLGSGERVGLRFYIVNVATGVSSLTQITSDISS